MSVQIRMATAADVEQIQAIYAPFCAEDSPVSFEIVAPTPAEIARRLARTLATHPWLVCDRGGTILGYAYGCPHAERAAYLWSASTAIYIGAGHRGAGVGRALYTALLALLRAQGFASAYAGTTLPNPASVGLHRALGFEPVGVYRDVGYAGGQWLDTAWWQVSLNGRMVDPRPPVAIGALLGSAAWDDAIAAGQAQLRDR